MDLDNIAMFRELDMHDALGDLEAAPQQWAQAAGLIDRVFNVDEFDAVVVAGMGGSGIVGDVAAALMSRNARVPVVAHKGYGLPGFVTDRSLVVGVSYSGTTGETCSAVQEALRRRARVLGVSSGGSLRRLCGEASAPHVDLPRGLHPRHALGYLLVPVLVALGLVEGVHETVQVQEGVVARCHRKVGLEENPAKALGQRIAHTGSISLYGTPGIGDVAAYRWKCQLNENAKLPATSASLPEAAHNELVGWEDPRGRKLGVVLLCDSLEGGLSDNAIAAVELLLREHAGWHERIDARGDGPLAQAFSLMLLGDFVSVYTALALDRDPSPILSIERFKRLSR